MAGVTKAANEAPPTRIDRREVVFFLPSALECVASPGDDDTSRFSVETRFARFIFYSRFYSCVPGATATRC